MPTTSPSTTATVPTSRSQSGWFQTRRRQTSSVIPEKSLGHLEDVLRLRENDADARQLVERLLEVGALRQRAARVLEVVEAGGDLDAWHILLNQPFHRTRPPDLVLRRFWGTTSGRKEKYAALLAAALDPALVPAPLAGVLAAVG